MAEDEQVTSVVPFIQRQWRREVRVGNLIIGGDAPILVQSMTTSDTRDVEATLQQIAELASAGCELVRLAVLNSEAAKALPEICRRSPLPLVADIHFDHRLALAAIVAGVVKLRLNPGNIGSATKVRQVAEAAEAAEVAIRIGINSASLEKEILARYGGATPEGMVESALGHVHLLEEVGFEDIIISLKAPDVPRTVQAYRLMAKACDYPLHIGITHAGPPGSGSIVSSVGLGILLAEGLGDTIRVSLTGDPVLEVQTAFRILESLEIRRSSVRLISCPTCGRCRVDLAAITSEVERLLSTYHGEPLTVAVMGCEVNGPGEAKEADIGLAAGQGQGLIFVKGEVVAKAEPDNLLQAFIEELNKIRFVST